MFLVDDILLSPLKGVMWLCAKLQDFAEQETLDDRPLLEAILENEVAFEEGSIDAATHAERERELMAALRSVRETKQRLAEERAAAARAAAGEEEPPEDEAPPQPGAPLSGRFSIEIDADFDSWGPGDHDRA